MGSLSYSPNTLAEVVAASPAAALGPQLADPIFLAALRALAGGQPVTPETFERPTAE